MRITKVNIEHDYLRELTGTVEVKGDFGSATINITGQITESLKREIHSVIMSVVTEEAARIAESDQ